MNEATKYWIIPFLVGMILTTSVILVKRNITDQETNAEGTTNDVFLGYASQGPLTYKVFNFTSGVYVCPMVRGEYTCIRIQASELVPMED